MSFDVHNINGLVFWNEADLIARRSIQDQLAHRVQHSLQHMNPAWRVTQIEGSQLVPRDIINPEYSDDDVWVQSGTGTELVLRPETTPSTYAYIRQMMDGSSKLSQPPICVWQAGKSFRREQDQPRKFMRLKEFYQQEFQCVYTDDTKNDYRNTLMCDLSGLISTITGSRCRIIESDRVPVYAESTIDIEAYDVTNSRWMEVCSCSIRTDFPGTYSFTSKKGTVEKGLLVLEVAVGLDRVVHLMNANVAILSADFADFADDQMEVCQKRVNHAEPSAPHRDLEGCLIVS